MADTRNFEYLIVGGGVASAHAAKGIREIDKTGTVAILCGEPHMPYDRPPLSKVMLLGKVELEDVESRDRSFYTENNVEVLIDRMVASIDREAKVVTTASGETYSYGKLLLATGASPVRPNIPGTDLSGVFFLRKVEDSMGIRDALKTAKTAVMVGTGYIGMEVASACITSNVKVTLVDPAPFPWSKFASEATGKFLQGYFEKHGASFLPGDGVVSIEGEGSVQRVRTTNGQVIDADLVVVGVGIRLNLDLPKSAGLDMDGSNGVRTDEYLQTSDPSIWAAGDIASFKDIALDKRWHADHYMNGQWQGTQAGRNMAGAGEKFDQVAYFFSDMLDLSMILRGDPSGGKSAKIVGDLQAGDYVELYSREDGSLAMGLAFGHDWPKMDPLVDRIAELVRERKAVDSIDEGVLAGKVGAN